MGISHPNRSLKEEVIALRINWDGRGPFWCERTRRLIDRLCRQATPGWKKSTEVATFLDYYCATAESPYDQQDFDWHLSRLKDGDESLAFGFADGHSAISLLGLTDELYEKQFKAMLRRKEFTVKAFCVQPLAQSKKEVMYRRAEASWITDIRSLDELKAI